MASRLPVAERRQALVEAAFRVIARGGLRAATTRAICEEAGVPQGTFHYCFRSKQEMFQELAIALSAIPSSWFPTKLGSDPRTAVRALFMATWNEVLAHPDWHMTTTELSTASLRDKEFAGLAQWQYRTYFVQAVERLRVVEATTNARWKLPHAVVARMLVAVLDGLTISWLTDRDDSAAQEAIEGFVTSFTALLETDQSSTGRG